MPGRIVINLLGIPLRHGWLHPSQALADPQDSVDEHAVGRPLDLKVAEQGVGAEQGQRLVENVIALAFRVDVKIAGAGGEGGECVGWAARLGAEIGESEVAWRKNRLGVHCWWWWGTDRLRGRRCRGGRQSGMPSWVVSDAKNVGIRSIQAWRRQRRGDVVDGQRGGGDVNLESSELEVEVLGATATTMAWPLEAPWVAHLHGRVSPPPPTLLTRTT